jgi:hypothetical protein
MAKKKNKSSKSLLPKRIAGVKVPRAVRKGRFGQLLASPAGQKLILEAIAAAGVIATAGRAKDSRKVRQFAHDAAGALRGVGHGAQDGASTLNTGLALAFGEAARAFTEALRRDAPTRTTAESDWSPAPVMNGADGDGKKNTSSPYEAGPL